MFPDFNLFENLPETKPESSENSGSGHLHVAALAGAAGKVFYTNLSDRAWCLIYLAFGWLAVLVIGPVVPSLPPLAIAMLVVAGITYSGGVLLYLNHAIPFRRALWHACVIIGAAGHYGAVMIGLVLS